MMLTINNSEINGVAGENPGSAIFAYEYTNLDRLIINGGKVIGADGENGYPAIWFGGEAARMLRDGSVIINGATVKGGNAKSDSGSGGSAIKLEIKYGFSFTAICTLGFCCTCAK